LNKILLVIPIIIAIAGISAFVFIDSTSVEAVETDQIQDVDLTLKQEPEGKDFYIEIHDGVGSSDSLN
jgi:hypothetical protein